MLLSFGIIAVIFTIFMVRSHYILPNYPIWQMGHLALKYVVAGGGVGRVRAGEVHHSGAL